MRPSQQKVVPTVGKKGRKGGWQEKNGRIGKRGLRLLATFDPTSRPAPHSSRVHGSNGVLYELHSHFVLHIHRSDRGDGAVLPSAHGTINTIVL